ncbi:MAG: hypothetical protein LH616_04865 [Ilumatobacteraceae bacterium]|nr:hypothetical protein [Ilumatobacteraceae bacterium]
MLRRIRRTSVGGTSVIRPTLLTGCICVFISICPASRHATVTFIVIVGVVVFAMDAIVVRRKARRLDAVARRSVYVPQEALEFVAEYLPADAPARLTVDELEQLLTFHMRWLHSKGLQPSNVIDRRQDVLASVVIDEDTLTAYLLGEAEWSGVDVVEDVDVRYVVEAHMAYFGIIGVVGPPAAENDQRVPVDPESVGSGDEIRD